MVKVVNNEVVEVGLPKHFYKQTGTHRFELNVSVDELRNMGWKTLRNDFPTYDAEFETLVFDYYEILETKVVAHYKVEPLPTEEEEFEKSIFEN